MSAADLQEQARDAVTGTIAPRQQAVNEFARRLSRAVRHAVEQHLDVELGRTIHPLDVTATSSGGHEFELVFDLDGKPARAVVQVQVTG